MRIPVLLQRHLLECLVSLATQVVAAEEVASPPPMMAPHRASDPTTAPPGGGHGHEEEVEDEFAAALAAHAVERKRACVVRRLRAEIEAAVRPHVARSVPHGASRKALNSLFAAWALNAANFEWMRHEAPPTSALAAVHDGHASSTTTTPTPTRDWVCPFLDEGCEVVLRLSGDAESARSRYVVAPWSSATATDDAVRVIVVYESSGGGAPTTASFLLAALRLHTAKPFVRDVLIPALEDEPAGRCGNSALYSRLRFTLGVDSTDVGSGNGSVLDRVMQTIAARATAARLEVCSFAVSVRSAVAGARSSRDAAAAAHSAMMMMALPERDTSPKFDDEGDAASTNPLAMFAVTQRHADTDDASGGDEIVDDVTIRVGPYAHDISAYHFVKLRVLYLRNRVRVRLGGRGGGGGVADDNNELSCIASALRDPAHSTAQRFNRAVDVIQGRWANRSSDSGSSNGNTDNDDDSLGCPLFALRAATVLCRYATLDGGPAASSYSNMHAAIHPAFVAAVQAPPLSVSCEGFANPFNTGAARFGSLFVDTDRHFGSLGSFWDVELAPSREAFEVNPPFESNVVRRMAAKLHAALDAAAAAAAENPHQPAQAALSVLVVLPTPVVTTAEGRKFADAYRSLCESRHCVGAEIRAGADCPYLEGHQQGKGEGDSDHRRQQQHQQQQQRPLLASLTGALETITLPGSTTTILLRSVGDGGGGGGGGGAVALREAMDAWRSAAAAERDAPQRRGRE